MNNEKFPQPPKSANPFAGNPTITAGKQPPGEITTLLERLKKMQIVLNSELDHLEARLALILDAPHEQVGENAMTVKMTTSQMGRELDHSCDDLQTMSNRVSSLTKRVAL